MNITKNLLLIPVLTLCACATTSTSKETESATSEAAPVSPATITSSNTNSTRSETGAGNLDDVRITKHYLRQPVGVIVRDLNQLAGGGIVLMNGVEAVILPELNLNNESPRAALQRLAEATSLSVHITPHYDFAYDPAYEALATLRLDDAIPESYADIHVDLAIGSDTPLFGALALLGHSTGLTLVADNAIGEAACGELALTNVPLPQALEALLQSARVPRANVRILATDEYLFFASPAHRMRRELLASADETGKLLDETCTLSLLVYESAEGQMNSQLGASPLSLVLPELSLQLGMPVEAEAALHNLPVNPVVMNNVSRSMALNLLVRQWMVPAFQYEVRDGTVYLVRAD